MRKFIALLALILEKIKFVPKKKQKYVEGRSDKFYPLF